MNVIQQRKSLIMFYSFDIFIHKFLMELRANGIIDEMSFLQNGEVVRIKRRWVKGRHDQMLPCS